LRAERRYRCGQPGQQQGRRFPFARSERIRSTLPLLVSAFLVEVTQQIHSFRASGVMSFHATFVAALDAMAFCKSAGNLCTTPAAMSFLFISIQSLV
jgi:hypothetical protein